MFSSNVTVVNGMVRQKTADRSTGTKEEEERLLSLQRNLTTAKRLGDSEEVKDLEHEIKELLAEIDRRTK